MPPHVGPCAVTEAFLAYDPFGPALSPVAVLLLLTVLHLYRRGQSRPARLRPPVTTVQTVFFLAGLGSIALASNAPLAPLGHSLFSAHQAEHLTLRLLGPLLIALSRPWHLIHAALPRRWRRRVVSFRDRRLTRGLAHPAVATAMLIASLYVWQAPAAYELAQKVPAVELLAHMLMMATGLWYFAMLLDPRDPPEGQARGARLMSGFVLIVSNILLGSLTTLKETVVYSDLHSLAWSGTLSPMADETIGGYTIWIPSSLIIILAIILVLNEWHRAEERRWANRFANRRSNSAALEFPETAEELYLKVAGPNRQMGRSLALGTLAMFCLVVVTAISVLSLAR